MAESPIYDSNVNSTTAFRFEREMGIPIISFLPSLFQPLEGQRTLLLREQAVGSVIPDIMFGIWSGELPRCSGFNAVSRQILACLSVEKKVDSEQQLRARFFLSEKATGNAISLLQRIGAVSKRNSGELELRAEFNPSQSIYLVAIEMKLKRWREALLQATRYRTFADEAYVALDANQVRMTSAVENAFVSNGVGLLLQSGRTVEHAIPAEMKTPEPSAERLFAVSKFANARSYCLA